MKKKRLENVRVPKKLLRNETHRRTVVKRGNGIPDGSAATLRRRVMGSTGGPMLQVGGSN